jgi:hypothetical protein
MQTLTWEIKALIASAAILAAFAFGWACEAWRCDAQIAQVKETHVETVKTAVIAQNTALRANAQKLNNITTNNGKIDNETAKKMAQSDLLLAGNLRLAHGLRLDAGNASCPARADAVPHASTASGDRDTGNDAAGMRADMCRVFARLASIYADTADRRKARADGCINIYGSVADALK